MLDGNTEVMVEFQFLIGTIKTEVELWWEDISEAVSIPYRYYKNVLEEEGKYVVEGRFNSL